MSLTKDAFVHQTFTKDAFVHQTFTTDIKRNNLAFRALVSRGYWIGYDGNDNPSESNLI